MDETMAYQGSESQEIGRSSDLKVKDECWENLEKAYNSFKEHWAPPRVMVFVIYQVDSKEFEPCLPALKELEESEESKGRPLIYYRRHFLEVHYAAGHYAAAHYWLCLGAYGTGTIGGVRLPNQGPFKCIMVGDGGTGKSTYVKRKLTGEFEKKYEPTMGMHEHMLEVPTKQGSTRFLCVDTPGHEKPGIPRDSYYEGADCGIIFCDITAKQTQKDVSMWCDDVHRVCPDIPIVVCGNKVDLKKRQVKTKKVTFHMKKKLQYHEISAKSGYNLDKPFQYLAEKLAGYVEGANCI